MTDYTPDFVTIETASGRTTIVSIEDIDLAEFKWKIVCFSPKRITKRFYAIRYIYPNGKCKGILLARLVASRMIRRDLLSTEFIDHINGNSLDNRRCNLRIATDAENCQNQKRSAKNTSGYKGVRYIDYKRKWVARINANRKHFFLGYFDTAEEAYEAYCKAAIKYHKEFARFE